MKGNTKKLLIFFVLMVICFIFILVYFQLPTPFLTRLNASDKIAKHLSADTVDVRYDMKNNSYYVLKNGYKVSYNFKKNTISDENVNTKLDEVANKIYSDFLKVKKDTVEFPKIIFLSTELNADDTDKKEQKLYLLGVKERKIFGNEEEIRKKMLSLIHEIVNYLGDDFSITSIQFNYACMNGVYDLNKNFEVEILELSDERIMESINSVSEDNFDEEYLNWKNDFYKD